MIADFHFIRPWWLLAILPLLFVALRLWQSSSPLGSWSSVCDSHLLEYLVKERGASKRRLALFSLLLSALFLILSLAGPSWHKLPVPSYQEVQPRVIVLDMSEAMLEQDLKPNRLDRAKFKLHDLFNQKDLGQTGLVVYTSEPFVVSPLTEDAKTIDALISTLTPDIMPVVGQRLDLALQMAGSLITQAGYSQGQILVLTAETPSTAAIEEATKLAESSISVSVLPMLPDNSLNPLFQKLVDAGQGQFLTLSNDQSDLQRWLTGYHGNKQFSLQENNLIPLFRDEGRWFLIPAMIFLLPVFRRGWLQRIET